MALHYQKEYGNGMDTHRVPLSGVTPVRSGHLLIAKGDHEENGVPNQTKYYIVGNFCDHLLDSSATKFIIQSRASVSVSVTPTCEILLCALGAACTMGASGCTFGQCALTEGRERRERE